MDLDANERCSVCGSDATRPILEIPDVPVYCNVLWPSRAEALSAPAGDIALQFCSACGHVYNSAFDPTRTEYTENYNNSLHFSPRFNEYADKLAQRLIETYRLRGKDLIEIGCGKGDFLRLLCDKGGNRGIGFDRSYEPERASGDMSKGVRFIRDFYSAEYAHYPVDFVCCRHVLEHIDRPTEFLGALRGWIGDRTDTVLYFEVPDGMFTIDTLGIWDLIYEHCSYFTRRSLVRAFELAGFEIQALGESFGGQYLYIEARPAAYPVSPGFDAHLAEDDLDRSVVAFDEKYRAKVDFWQERLASAHDETVVVWGGGSKGVTFLNVLDKRGAIEYVVDLNPHKQGKFVPGSGQEVVAPEFLRAHRPTKVLVMNSIYIEEIRGAIDEMGLETAVECV
jgi:hypothetical protein